MRVALGIAYDGTDFVGWQRQPTLSAVQTAVEKALSTVAHASIKVTCAGRTDAGVHALQQVVHFDSPVSRTLRAWILGGNSALPKSVSIVWAKAVPEDFHARFSAQARQYRYILYNHAARPGLLHRHVAWECRALEVERMKAACAHFHGEHDFSALRGSGCQAKSPVRTIHHLAITRSGAFILIDVFANAFLHHMVRNLVGVLIPIGTGARDPAWAEDVIASRDRRHAGITAPPWGLYFVRPTYPDHFKIPDHSNQLFSSQFLPLIVQ